MLRLTWAWRPGIAAFAQDQGDDPQAALLNDYLHSHLLPLVNAQIVIQNGDRQVVLYGFTATDAGKSHAAQHTADFLRDPDVTILNRIKVRPELASLPPTSVAKTVPAPKEDQLKLPEESAPAPDVQAAVPDNVGDADAYASQQRNDESRYSNQMPPGVALMPFGTGMLGMGGGLPTYSYSAPIYPTIPNRTLPYYAPYPVGPPGYPPRTIYGPRPGMFMYSPMTGPRPPIIIRIR
jgi:hypothetical protein